MTVSRTQDQHSFPSKPDSSRDAAVRLQPPLFTVAIFSAIPIATAPLEPIFRKIEFMFHVCFTNHIWHLGNVILISHFQFHKSHFTLQDMLSKMQDMNANNKFEM